MDTQNDVIMAISQVSEELRKNKIVVGAKQLKKALKMVPPAEFTLPAMLIRPLQSPSPLCVS